MQAALDGFLRQQAGAQHQRRIRGVRAAGDRGNDHRTVRKLEFVAVVAHGDVLLRGAFHRLFEQRFRLPQRHAVLRAFRPGQSGLDGCEIEFERVGINRIRRRIGAEYALRLAVFLDEAHARLAAAGETQIGKRFSVDREKAHGGAVFGRHVGDRRAIRQAQAGKPGAIKLDKFPDHAFFAQHLGDDQHEVGRGRALGQTAVQLEADHFGDEHRQRLAEHGGFRFNAADAPAENAQAVHHGGVRIGADERIGKGLRLAVHGGVKHNAREVFKVHLMANARIRAEPL